MIIVDNQTAELLAGDFRKIVARILMDGVELSGEISALAVTKGSCGDASFAPSTVFSSYMDVTLKNCVDNINNRELVLQVGVDGDNVDDEQRWYDLGVFTALKPVRNVYSLSFTAVGTISAKMGELYVSSLTYPATVGAILSELSERTGVTITDNIGMSDYVVEKEPLNLKHREMLSYISGLGFGHACETVSGDVVINPFEFAPTYLTDGNRTTILPTFEDDAVTITGVKVATSELTEDEENTQFISKGDPVNMVIANPFMTEDIFTEKVDDLIGVSYDSGVIPITLGDFRLEPWDVLQVTDIEGNAHVVPCMHISNVFDGGLVTTVTAPTLGDAGTGVTAYRGALSLAINEASGTANKYFTDLSNGVAVHEKKDVFNGNIDPYAHLTDKELAFYSGGNKVARFGTDGSRIGNIERGGDAELNVSNDGVVVNVSLPEADDGKGTVAQIGANDENVLMLGRAYAEYAYNENTYTVAGRFVRFDIEDNALEIDFEAQYRATGRYYYMPIKRLEISFGFGFNELVHISWDGSSFAVDGMEGARLKTDLSANRRRVYIRNMPKPVSAITTNIAVGMSYGTQPLFEATGERFLSRSSSAYTDVGEIYGVVSANVNTPSLAQVVNSAFYGFDKTEHDADKFVVDYDGNVTAKGNMTLDGSINVGGITLNGSVFSGWVIKYVLPINFGTPSMVSPGGSMDVSVTGPADHEYYLWLMSGTYWGNAVVLTQGTRTTTVRCFNDGTGSHTVSGTVVCVAIGHYG